MARRLYESALAAALLLSVGSGCNLDNPGPTPPRGRINTPVALELSRTTNSDGEPRFLYIANANFTLRYNQGSVQALDLDALQRELQEREACLNPDDGDGQEEPNPDCEQRQEREEVGPRGFEIPLTGNGGLEDVLIASEVLIESFPEGLAMRPDGERLYTAIASDENLTFIDIETPGQLRCGGGQGRHECSARFRVGSSEIANERRLRFPGEPVDLVAGHLSDFAETTDDSAYVMVAHRAGAVSLFVEEPGEGTAPPARVPRLVHVRGGLREELTSITFSPEDDLFLLGTLTRSRAVLERVGVAVGANPSRAVVYDASDLGIVGISPGRGTTYDVRIDPERPSLPFAVSRRPTALLRLDSQQSSANQTRVRDIVEVGNGASRVVTGCLSQEAEAPAPNPYCADPNARLYAFVSCFDARQVYVVDVALGQIVTVLQGFSGPFAMALDRPRKYLYVADFSSSVLRVVDVGPLTRPPRPTPADALAESGIRIKATVGRTLQISQL